jgi:glutaredoxin
VKEFLSRKGIKYSEMDVAKDQRARDEMVQRTGRLAVPTIKVGNEVIVGFNPKELEKLLH